MDSRPMPGWVTAWELAYGAQLLARELDRQAWIDALAKAWCLIRIRESLTPRQASDQDDYVDRLLGLKFYPTQLNPIGFDGLVRNVQATPIAEVFGLECPVCGGPLEDRLGPFWCPGCQAPVSSWTLVVDILAGPPRDPFTRTDDHRQRVAELEARGFPDAGQPGAAGHV